MYSATEIERLILLRAATKAGHSIGRIAQLEDAQLRELVGSETPATEHLPPVQRAASGQRFVDTAIEKIMALDATGFEELLGKAAQEFGTQGLLQKVIVPLTYRVGELWLSGDVTAAEEHFASGHLRTFLQNISRPFVAEPTAPLILTGTPMGQHHELGAIIVGAAASSLGWRVANLSSSLPAAEIASAATRSSARAVALSVVYPVDDPQLANEFRILRRLLPEATEILVGGRAVKGYRVVLEEIGARICASCEQFCEEITKIREGR